MLFVVRYRMRDPSPDRVMAVYPRHRAYLDDFARAGTIVAIGPLRPAPGSGALAVFRTREAADAFPKRDPFVLERLAEPLPLEEWDALEFFE